MKRSFQFRIPLPNCHLRDVVEVITGWGCVEKIDSQLGLYCSFEHEGTDQELFCDVHDFELEIGSYVERPDIWTQVTRQLNGVPLERLMEGFNICYTQDSLGKGKKKRLVLVLEEDLKKLEARVVPNENLQS